MEHEAHTISEASYVGNGGRIIAILVIVAAVCGLGVYVVYGSGMWSPQPQHNATPY